METQPFNQAQLMVAAAAREVHDGDVVFVGMRLPLLGFQLAKNSHAPQAVGVYELGIIRDTAVPEPILTMGDLPTLYHAQWLADTADLMGLLQQGWVDVSFIGGAQVDRFGNLNTTYVGDLAGAFTRLPGSGGACDLASLAQRHIIIMKHERHRFVDRVDYDGGNWRARVGLPRGGPSAVITTLGILRFEPESKEMILTAVHPGVTVEEVVENTGWPLKIAQDVETTPAPTAAELALIQKFDPQGFWTG